MENKTDYLRLRKILHKKGYKKTKDYLQGEGYVFFKEIGWVKEARVDECVKKGLVKFTDDHDLWLTVKGAGSNCLFYLGGAHSQIQYSQVNNKPSSVFE